MIYARGNPQDYDEWAAGGATGWSYEDVLPYFIKSENIKNPLLKRSSMFEFLRQKYTLQLYCLISVSLKCLSRGK